MSHKPRNTHQRVMNRRFVKSFLSMGLAIGVSVTGAFLWTLFQDGWTYGASLNGEVRHAVTVAFASLVFVQLVNAFSARSFRRSLFQQNILENHFLVMAVISSVLMVLLMIYVPWLNLVLKTTPLVWADWAAVAVASLFPLLVLEIEKFFLRRRITV